MTALMEFSGLGRFGEASQGGTRYARSGHGTSCTPLLFLIWQRLRDDAKKEVTELEIENKHLRRRVKELERVVTSQEVAAKQKDVERDEFKERYSQLVRRHFPFIERIF